MSNQLHLEKMKEENAQVVQINIELVAMLKLADALIQEIMMTGELDYLHDELNDKIKAYMIVTRTQNLKEHDAQVIEKLIYGCGSPDLTQTNIKKALQDYANDLRES